MSTRNAVAGEARAALARGGITQSELAEATGRSRTYWQKRLSGGHPLTIDDLDAIASATGTPLADLLPRAS